MIPHGCLNCGGWLYHDWDGDKVCITCARRGPTVIADERHPCRLGHTPTYEGTVKHLYYLNAQIRKPQARRDAKRRRESA